MEGGSDFGEVREKDEVRLEPRRVMGAARDVKRAFMNEMVSVSLPQPTAAMALRQSAAPATYVARDSGGPPQQAKSVMPHSHTQLSEPVADFVERDGSDSHTQLSHTLVDRSGWRAYATRGSPDGTFLYSAGSSTFIVHKDLHFTP